VSNHLSITRLRLRSWRFVPAFLYYSVRSQRQACRSPGIIDGYVAQGPTLVFWTVTMWEDVAAMRAYRASGAHRSALPKLAQWCDEACTASLTVDLEKAPVPAVAADFLVSDGRIFKVAKPSVAQARGENWPDGVVPSVGGRITSDKSR
jgi:hypothetical protein